MNIHCEIDEVLYYLDKNNIDIYRHNIELGLDKWAELMKTYSSTADPNHYSIFTYNHSLGINSIIPNRGLPRHSISINNITLLDVIAERELLGD